MRWRCAFDDPSGLPPRPPPRPARARATRRRGRLRCPRGRRPERERSSSSTRRWPRTAPAASSTCAPAGGRTCSPRNSRRRVATRATDRRRPGLRLELAAARRRQRRPAAGHLGPGVRGRVDRMYSATLDPGASGFQTPVPVDFDVNEATSTFPDLAMARGGQAYLTYNVVTDTSARTRPATRGSTCASPVTATASGRCSARRWIETARSRCGARPPRTPRRWRSTSRVRGRRLAGAR